MECPRDRCARRLMSGRDMSWRAAGTQLLTWARRLRRLCRAFPVRVSLESTFLQDGSELVIGDPAEHVVRANLEAQPGEQHRGGIHFSGASANPRQL